jgi:hypothetical protein
MEIVRFCAGLTVTIPGRCPPKPWKIYGVLQLKMDISEEKTIRIYFLCHNIHGRFADELIEMRMRIDA